MLKCVTRSEVWCGSGGSWHISKVLIPELSPKRLAPKCVMFFKPSPRLPIATRYYQFPQAREGRLSRKVRPPIPYAQAPNDACDQRQ